MNLFVAWTTAFAARDTGKASGPQMFCVGGGALEGSGFLRDLPRGRQGGVSGTGIAALAAEALQVEGRHFTVPPRLSFTSAQHFAP